MMQIRKRKARGLEDTLTDIVHAVNGKLQAIDYCLFSPDPCENPGPVFLVGAPRSGSTLAFQILTQVLRVSYFPRILDYSYGVTNLAFRVLRSQLERPTPIFVSSYGKIPGLLSPSETFGYWRKWLYKGKSGDHSFSEPLPPAMAGQLRKYIYAFQGHSTAPLLVKCLYLSLAIPALSEAIPNARFVFVQRDPLSIAASVLRVRQRESSLSWWSVRPSGYERRSCHSPAEQAVWQVSETLRIVQDSLSQLDSERWCSLWFEDLCESPSAVAIELAGWLASHGYKQRDSVSLPDRFSPPARPSNQEIDLLKNTSCFEALMATRQ